MSMLYYGHYRNQLQIKMCEMLCLSCVYAVGIFVIASVTALNSQIRSRLGLICNWKNSKHGFQAVTLVKALEEFLQC